MNPLAARLAERIASTGPLSYASFVDAALYDEHDGFYATVGRAGRRGDFLTSAEVGPLFGTVIARALDTWWIELGRPSAYRVVECGAGPGTLARAVLAQRDTMACADALQYVTIERSSAQRAFHPADVEARAVLADDVFTGIIVANELLDNLPFDLVEARDGQWHDVHVDHRGGAFVETLGPPAVGVTRTAPGDGARMPRQTAVTQFVHVALERLVHGRLVAIDYTADTNAFITRPWRDWVRTYRQHQRGGNPLDDPGTQDLTCDVALDVLDPAPTEVSFQADFLRAHGIDALVDEGRAAWRDGAHQGGLAALRGRSRVREAEALCDPKGLGGFSVMQWVC